MTNFFFFTSQMNKRAFMFHDEYNHWPILNQLFNLRPISTCPSQWWSHDIYVGVGWGQGPLLEFFFIFLISHVNFFKKINFILLVLIKEKKDEIGRVWTHLMQEINILRPSLGCCSICYMWSKITLSYI